MFKSVLNCFGFEKKYNQELNNKKNDDLKEISQTVLLEKTRKWVQIYSKSKIPNYMKKEEIQKIVSELLGELAKFSINESNIEIITPHLAEIATHSTGFQECLLNSLREKDLQCTRDDKKLLVNKVLFTIPSH